MELYDDGFGSTLDQGTAHRRQLGNTVRVPVERLSRLLEREGVPEDIHFLKVDVENHEKEVLMGMDFQRFRPWLIVLESTLPLTSIPSHENWEYILLQNGYTFLAQHGINRYYCAGEHREHLVANYLSAPVFAPLTKEQIDALQICLFFLLKNKGEMED